MASYMIPPITGGPSTPWNYQNNPYRQRAAPVGTLDAPIGSNPGGNPFSGIPGLSAGQYPGVSPDIWSQVMGVVNPQLQNAADIINRRSAMGSGAITGLTNFMAQEMGGLQGMVGQAYNPGIKLGKNVANWSNTSLTQSGAAQDASVAQQMAVGNAGPVAKSSDLNLTQQGKGAGGAAYGTGIAEVDNLIAARAAAQTRSALEPSFAAMTGQQQQAILAGQLARQLSEMQGNITAQIPQLLLDLQSRADAKAADTRDYNERIREYNQDRLDKLTAAKSTVVGPNAPTTRGRLAYWQQQADFRTKHDPNGWVWEGTTSGIHPVRDKKTGKPIIDPGYTAAVQEGLLAKQKQQLAVNKAKADRMQITGSDAAGRVMVDTLTGDVIQIQKPGEKVTKPITKILSNGRVVTYDPNTKKITYGGTVQNNAGSTGKNPAPHRVGPKKWRDWRGKPLSPKATIYWENQFNNGFTDGKGKLTAGTPAQIKANTGQEGSTAGGKTSKTYVKGAKWDPTRKVWVLP